MIKNNYLENTLLKNRRFCYLIEVIKGLRGWSRVSKISRILSQSFVHKTRRGSLKSCLIYGRSQEAQTIV